MVEIKLLQSEDLEKLTQLIRLYERVFEMETFVLPSQEYLQYLLDRPGATFLVALIDKQVVGGLTAHELPSTYFESNEVYVYDLAVAQGHQRKGIGEKLLDELGTLCKKRGDKEFFVQADIDDKHALEFYHATGGVPEKVIHFSYDTKS